MGVNAVIVRRLTEVILPGPPRPMIRGDGDHGGCLMASGYRGDYLGEDRPRHPQLRRMTEVVGVLLRSNILKPLRQVTGVYDEHILTRLVSHHLIQRLREVRDTPQQFGGAATGPDLPNLCVRDDDYAGEGGRVLPGFLPSVALGDLHQRGDVLHGPISGGDALETCPVGVQGDRGPDLGAGVVSGLLVCRKTDSIIHYSIIVRVKSGEFVHLGEGAPVVLVRRHGLTGNEAGECAALRAGVHLQLGYRVVPVVRFGLLMAQFVGDTHAAPFPQEQSWRRCRLTVLALTGWPASLRTRAIDVPVSRGLSSASCTAAESLSVRVLRITTTPHSRRGVAASSCSLNAAARLT